MRKKSLIGIAIAAAMIIGLAAVYADYASIERPWLSQTCEEMIEFAMSPDHNIFSEKQHIEFHKALQPCVDNMQMHMNP